MTTRRYGITRPWLAVVTSASLRLKSCLGMLWSQRSIQIEAGARLAPTVRVRGAGQVIVRAGATIGPEVTLIVEDGAVIDVGPRARIGSRSCLNARSGQRIGIGAEAIIEEEVLIVSVAGAEIGAGALIGARTAVVCREESGNGSFRLGDRSHLSVDNLVDLCASVTVGPEVRTGPGCAFYTHKHTPSSSGLIWDQPIKTAAITVGDGTWIGHGCQVMPGVDIGGASVVGAGAIVTKSIPAGTISAGVPARQLGTVR